MVIDESKLCELREKVGRDMSAKRYNHTLEVEKMAARLAALYAPEKTDELRAAALLHDITKEYSNEQHRAVCAEYGVEISELTASAPKTFHAITAALLIPKLYPDFASEDIIDCVRWHTTARADMSIPEAIVYLADYIDMSRSFEDCVELRSFFWDADPESMSESDRREHLRRTLIRSLDMTVSSLIESGKTVSSDTFEARNSLIIKGI